MRTTRFLVTIIAFGAFTFGPGFAGQHSNPAPERTPSGNRANTTGDRSPGARRGGEGPASAKSSRSSGTKITAKPHPGPRLPQPFQANGGHPGEKRTNNAQTGLNKAAAGAKAVSTINEMDNQRHLPLAGLSGAPPPNYIVAHRGPGPAILGGPTISSARNAAAINWTGMKHKL